MRLHYTVHTQEDELVAQNVNGEPAIHNAGFYLSAIIFLIWHPPLPNPPSHVRFHQSECSCDRFYTDSILCFVDVL